MDSSADQRHGDAPTDPGVVEEGPEGQIAPAAAGPFQVTLRGGRPWGFTLQGGSEVGAPLTVAKVSQIIDTAFAVGLSYMAYGQII